MRQERTVQANIFEIFATHEIGHELKAMSPWLDEHRDLIGLVARDLVRVGVKAAGDRACRPKRCCVVRCSSNTAQLSYQELPFHLEDSASFHATHLPWSAPASRTSSRLAF